MQKVWQTGVLKAGQEVSQVEAGPQSVTQLSPFSIYRDNVAAGRWELRTWLVDKHPSWKQRRVQAELTFSSKNGDHLFHEKIMLDSAERKTISFQVPDDQAPASLRVGANSHRIKSSKWFAELYFAPAAAAAAAAACSSSPTTEAGSYLDGEQKQAEQQAQLEASAEAVQRRMLQQPKDGWALEADKSKLVRPFLLCVSMDSLMRLNLSRLLGASLRKAEHQPHHEAFRIVAKKNRTSLAGTASSMFTKLGLTSQDVSWRQLLLNTITELRQRVGTHRSLFKAQDQFRKQHLTLLVDPAPLPGGGVSYVGDPVRCLATKAPQERYVCNMSEHDLEVMCFNEIAAYQQTMVTVAIDVHRRSGGAKLKFKFKPWRVELGVLVRTTWQAHPRVQQLFANMHRWGFTDPDAQLHLLEMAVKSQLDFTGKSPDDLAQQVAAVHAMRPEDVVAVVEDGRMFGIRSRATLNKPKIASEFTKEFCIGLGISTICPLLGTIMDINDVGELLFSGTSPAVCAAAVLVLLVQKLALYGQAIDFEQLVARFQIDCLHKDPSTVQRADLSGGDSIYKQASSSSSFSASPARYTSSTPSMPATSTTGVFRSSTPSMPAPPPTAVFHSSTPAASPTAPPVSFYHSTTGSFHSSTPAMPPGTAFHSSTPGTAFHSSTPGTASFHSSTPGTAFHSSTPGTASFHSSTPAMPPGTASFHSTTPAMPPGYAAPAAGAWPQQPGGWPPQQQQPWPGQYPSYQ